jgi:hypothetical protein
LPINPKPRMPTVYVFIIVKAFDGSILQKIAYVPEYMFVIGFRFQVSGFSWAPGGETASLFEKRNIGMTNVELKNSFYFLNF